MTGHTDAAQTAQSHSAPGTTAQDTTAQGKPHFEVLDGLRGSAALLVVLFHIQGITVGFQGPKLWLHHAYLAVDFFFGLSGFVIGYAYDDRWGRMGLGAFVRTRLVRLHPLVVLGALMGFASYVLDPFSAEQAAVPLSSVLFALALSLLALPAGPLPNRWTDTHTLNGPTWTLLQEYIGNIAYALVLRRLPNWGLGVVAAVGAVALIVAGQKLGSLDSGWGFDNFAMGLVRMTFPFVMGLLLYRLRDRLPRWQVGFGPLSLVLVVAFALPTWEPSGGIAWNGLYEVACVLILFPLIVLAGAHSAAGWGGGALCRQAGRLSYPLYITHYPACYVWMNYVIARHPAPAQAALVGAGLLALSLVVAWSAARFWDEPVRRALRIG
ncbi:acyltransferase family protein [Novosphingobium sp. FSY-8]|uniref:Acyltransferase family protein n=1 Tax=Novosphingobium ovatum TaxID=1908523 RepID=A0ABW9XHT7_9SPHN|nr:acyltransferase [Novosphingobium ovatum]NBC38136.1 acyltransferase family protein [Novosphingobium ovatum]